MFVKYLLNGGAICGLGILFYGCFLSITTDLTTKLELFGFIKIESPLSIAVLGLCLFFVCIYFLNPKEKEILDRTKDDAFSEIIKCLRLAISSIDNSKNRQSIDSGARNKYDFEKLKKEAQEISKNIVIVATDNRKLIGKDLENKLMYLNSLSINIYQLSSEKTLEQLDKKVQLFRDKAKELINSLTKK